eukprot:CAMPEP_0114015324 /NCGR_PEP_ID=MMETSP0372-20130328/12500_1 /TAXON_ID=340204 /ORGANISM="Lankesteria abbotti" /LENGTH=40 /assembly_acc=CAM_ASM_000359
MTMEEYRKATNSKMGEIALAMSHMNAIKQAYDDGSEVAVI